MDATTQFYIDETMTFLGYNPQAQAAIAALQSQLQQLAMNSILQNAPNGLAYARYCADKFIADAVAAQVVPEMQRFGEFIGVDQPAPPPPPG